MMKCLEQYKQRLILFLPIVVLLAMEIMLSLMQIFRYKGDVKPYYVTPLLRPLVKMIAPEDFYPRTHDMYGTPWDYKTDRMRPGVYPQAEDQPDYTINSYGLRGPEFAIPKPDGIYRIIIFGSSSTFGVELADDQTFPAMLERILKDKIKDKKIEVLNYGMASKSLYYSARKYFLETDTLQPDMVIINNIRNTWYQDQDQEFANYGDIELPENYFQVKLNNFLTDNSLVYRLWRKERQKKINVSFMQKVSGEVTYNRAFFDTLYYKVIRSIYLDAQRKGIALALSLEPMYVDPQQQRYAKQKTNEELYGLLENDPEIDKDIIFSTLLYNNIYKLKNEADNLIIVDPMEYFLQAKESFGATPFMGRFHLTEQANKAFAQITADQILPIIEK